MLCLLVLRWRNMPSRCRSRSPVSGSSFATSAPRSAKALPQNCPAGSSESSTTTRPSSSCRTRWLFDDVVVRAGDVGELAVVLERPGGEGVDLALRVLVVAVLDRRVRPDQRPDLLLVALDVLVVGVLAHLNG